jgi:hypothetical protein
MNNINSMPTFSPNLAGSIFSSPESGVIGYYKDFRQQLLDLVLNLQDQNASLTLEGKTLSAAAKNGTSGQMLINDWLDTEQTTMSTMMDALKFMQGIEKQAAGFSTT